MGSAMNKTTPIEVTTFLSHDIIERKIYLIRKRKIMFDRDLAALYGVSTSYLNRQVKRNLDRFPADFMFQLDKREFKNLMCQIGTSSWGGSRKLPRAFTDYGILMLSSVINSQRAVHVNIEIMRTFARLRQLLSSHKVLRRKIDEMEKKYDKQFQVVFEAIKRLLEPPTAAQKKPIGFHA